MKTTQILTAVKFIAWVVFIGLCIQTGTIIYSFLVSLFINPEAAKNLDSGLNLSGLYSYNKWLYILLGLSVISQFCLKAYMTYSVLKIFLKTNFVRPFSANIAALIRKISYISFAIGVLALIANACNGWLIKKGMTFGNLQNFSGGGNEFLFFGGIIFVIALVFKRGIEIQSENDLTI